MIYGLGGSRKAQAGPELCTHAPRRLRIDVLDKGRIERIVERDYLSMYRLLFGRLSAGSELPTVAEAVTMVKSWIHDRSGRSLVIFNGAATG